MTEEPAMAEQADLFPGFATERIKLDDVEIHARVGGSGPPLLCLHGYPQTHVCWHLLAPVLSQQFTVVAMDLRGYGESSVPPAVRGHESYAKRTMARDCIAVMDRLGFSKFHIMGHDRGARVAYRLTLDTPDAIDRLVLLDIVPTIEVWEDMGAASATRSYHWTFLAQAAPLPETLISGAAEAYIDMTLTRWTRDKTLDVFDPAALQRYRALFSEPERITAVCEDYRAGSTVDAAIDAQDRAAGRKINPPTLFLWGRDYLGHGGANPLPVWQRWCDHVEGHAIDSGHFLAEENADATVKAIMPFLKS